MLGFKEPLDRFLGVVRPRNFGAGEGRKMLSHMKTMFDNGYTAVHPSFSDMIIALRSAYSEQDALDKQRSSNNDLWDSAALRLYWWRLQNYKAIGIRTATENFKKQHDSSTGVTSYMGTSSLWIKSEKIYDLDIHARLFSNNGTGILEMVEKR